MHSFITFCLKFGQLFFPVSLTKICKFIFDVCLPKNVHISFLIHKKILKCRLSFFPAPVQCKHEKPSPKKKHLWNQFNPKTFMFVPDSDSEKQHPDTWEIEPRPTYSSSSVGAPTNIPLKLALNKSESIVVATPTYIIAAARAKIAQH